MPKASFSCLIAGEPYRAPLHSPFGRPLRDASPDMGVERFGRLDGGSRIPSHGRASAAHNRTDSSLGCSEECEGQGDKAAGAEGFGSLRDEGFARLRLVGAGHSGPVLRTRERSRTTDQGGHHAPAPGIRPGFDNQAYLKGFEPTDAVRKLYGVASRAQ